MKNKILSLIALIVMVVGFSFMGTGSVQAQASPFPDGCSSALGASVTTGFACNGTSSATVGPLAGCTTALGYSVTNGAPCSGSSVALSYLAGCSSLYGYSVIDGKPCNGTTVATIVPVVTPPPVTTPGLPTTGAGGNAFSNLMMLLASGAVAVAGLNYLVRKPKVSS